MHREQLQGKCFGFKHEKPIQSSGKVFKIPNFQKLQNIKLKYVKSWLSFRWKIEALKSLKEHFLPRNCQGKAGRKDYHLPRLPLPSSPFNRLQFANFTSYVSLPEKFQCSSKHRLQAMSGPVVGTKGAL